MFRFCFIAAIALYFLSGCATGGQRSQSATNNKDKPVASNAQKEQATIAKSEKTRGTVCTRGEDQRSIEVIRLPERAVSSGSNKVCEVIYTKFSKSQSVASSVRSTDHCEGVLNKIQGNLEASGYTCKI